MNITYLEMVQAIVEIFWGLICLMSAYIIIINGQKNNSLRMFKYMFLTATIIFFSEAGACIYRGNIDDVSIWMTRLCNLSVFFFNFMLIGLYIRYIYESICEYGSTPGEKYIRITNAICVIVACFLLLNIFTKWIYYFDDRNYYHRNWGWLFYISMAIIVITLGLGMAFRHRKAIGERKLISIVIFACVPAVAIVVNAFYYGISITNIGVGIGLLFMLFVYLKEWTRKEQEEGENRNRSKGYEIIILYVIMVVSMSASIISCVFSINRISHEYYESDNQMIANMVSDSVENEFLKPITVSKTMANDYSLKQFLKQSDAMNPQKVERQMAEYLNSIRTGFGYQMVFAVSDGSKAYYTYNGISKIVDILNDEHDIWYKNFVESGEVYKLDVDTDEANNWDLSVFVNTQVLNSENEFIGVCGVGVEMTELQEVLRRYESMYGIKITLINEDGLIQVSSDGEAIERDYLDKSYLGSVSSYEFYYEKAENACRLTKYMDDLGWYLVIENNNPSSINVAAITTPSILIFLLGIVMMGVAFAIIYIRGKRVEQELEEKRRVSITDELTGLLNRRAFEEACERIEEKALLQMTTVIIMDINGLKEVNDAEGHVAGDEIIIGAAKCISTTFGTHGKTYRIGGDEFAVLLTCSKEQLKDSLKTFSYVVYNWKGKHVDSLSISKGVVIGEDFPNMTLEQMRNLADIRMYEDKENYYATTGKDRRRH